MTNETLPIAGAAALGLLALGGAGLVARRRKRRREDEEFEARQQALAMAAAEPEAEAPLELEPADEVRAGPVFARAAAPIHDPVPDKKGPATAVPEGFDLSRFGPHVQAAYRGPTADNPSVSLQYRLRQAAALDEQERSPADPVEHR
ncbi:MAG TPA: LPXTG cell wall anchor domain-containing protein [Sphingomicrobium sp.]|nr:LPXTG cell wall anchor domain-containing protein [Sphingomicrobium sp.]